ncbi:hypothetical protein ACEWY4_013042 [Coilia grayii]|uniref:Urotensin II n=1 Tax=Coilia grayii TaxID=363190 RepID=A0ABD1JV91_9TELE
MLWRTLACCCLIILASAASLLAHPVTYLGDMSYSTQESTEEDQLVGDKLDLVDSAYLPQETPRYPLLFTGEFNREGLKTAGLSPGQTTKEVLLEKPVINPLSRFLGSRRQYGKRGGNTECFWKYCV